MDRKRILITGANGFIGRYLKTYYKGLHEVYAPGRAVLDLTNNQSVDNFFANNQFDTVIHCALIGRDNINSVDQNIVNGNLSMFTNLWRNRHRFNNLINMGTGNEFDTSTNIENATENELFNHLPVASYAYVKNLVARICSQTENFYNMRLFGVFHHTEVSRRFFKRLHVAKEPFHIFQDQYFDFFNLEDLMPMIDCIVQGEAVHQDINMCYQEKYLQSELALIFAEIHGIDKSLIEVDSVSNINFTGDASRLMSYNFKLKGLNEGLLAY